MIGDTQETDLDISSLYAISCILRDSLPSEFSADFKVLYYGFYLRNKVIEGGTEKFLSNAKNLADAERPYYILLSNQLSPNGEIKYFIEFKLPRNWLPYCFDPLIVKSFENSVMSKFKNLSTKYNSPGERIALETEGLKYLATKFGKYTTCCVPNANLRSLNQCSNCISAFDVLNEMENLGFEPIFSGQVTNSVITEDQNCLYSEALPALKDNNGIGNRSSSVSDYANLSITIDGKFYDFGQELVSWATSGNTAIVTKNYNYCTASLFVSQTTTFNGATNAAWLHVWENPIASEEDIVFVKTKFNFPTTNLVAPGFSIRNVQADPLPAYKYEIVHRSFASWDRFGHFPVFYNVHKARNSFHGDNRGFSLGESIVSSNGNSNGVIARIHQKFNIKLGKGPDGEQEDPNPFNSLTTGYRNCMKTIPAIAPIQGNSGGGKPSQPAKEVTDLGESKGFEKSITKNNIFYTSMFFEGSNPLFIYGPDIEWFLDLGWYYKKNNQSINISGRVIGKSYPAYESYIKDNCGNKVFLHTYQAPCESALVGQLMWPLPDYNEPFDLSFTTDTNGCFTGEMKVGTTSTTISAWNSLNLSKSPAKDCPSSPCQGCYPNDNTDKRSFFNCND